MEKSTQIFTKIIYQKKKKLPNNITDDINISSGDSDRGDSDRGDSNYSDKKKIEWISEMHEQV